MSRKPKFFKTEKPNRSFRKNRMPSPTNYNLHLYSALRRLKALWVARRPPDNPKILPFDEVPPGNRIWVLPRALYAIRNDPMTYHEPSNDLP